MKSLLLLVIALAVSVASARLSVDEESKAFGDYLVSYLETCESVAEKRLVHNWNSRYNSKISLKAVKSIFSSFRTILKFDLEDLRISSVAEESSLIASLPSKLTMRSSYRENRLI